MLNITAIQNADYYASLAAVDYYLKGGEPPGIWLGSAAKELSLFGRVEQNDLVLVLDGFAPTTAPERFGEKMVQNAGRKKTKEKRGRDSGWDFTVSCPKSVSVLWSQVDYVRRERIQQIVHRATVRSLEFVEQELTWTRRGKEGKTTEQAEKLLAAYYEHGSNRELEPQLHAHVVLPNLCIRQDGKTGAVLSHPFYTNRDLVGAVFRSELARLLMLEEGLILEKDRDYFRVVGIPDGLEEFHSTRRKQILEQLQRMGLNGGRAAEVACKDTRRVKKDIPPRITLFEKWSEQNHKFGFTEEVAENLLDQHTGLHEFRYEQFLSIAEKARKRAVSDRSYFTAFGFLKLVLFETQCLGVPVEKLQEYSNRFLMEDEEVIELRRERGETYYSTPEIIAQEKWLVQQCRELAAQHSHPVGAYRLGQAIRRQQKKLTKQGLKLGADQENAIQTLVATPGDLQLLNGLAGTGKTTVLSAVKEAYEKSGFRMLGTAISNSACQVLRDDTGISCHTITKLLGDWSLPPGAESAHHAKMLLRAAQGKKTWTLEKPKPFQLDSRTVLVLDEASMVGTDHMQRLVSSVRKAGAKLLVIGDDRQLESIDAGGPFHSLVQRFRPAELENVVRQRDDWGRELAMAAAKGDSAAALRILQANAAIEGADDEEALYAKAVAKWRSQGLTDCCQIAIFAPENRQVHALNLACQSERQAAGQLRKRCLTLAYQASSGDTYSYKAYLGDKVLLTKNSKRYGYHNGDTGILRKFENGKAVVELSRNDGRGRPVVVTVPYKRAGKRCDPGLRLGYATSVYKAQGQTVDTAISILSGSLINRANAYVAFTRHRNEFHCFALKSDLDGYATTLEDCPLAMKLRSGKPPGLAIDLLGETTEGDNESAAKTMEQWAIQIREERRQQRDDRRILEKEAPAPTVLAPAPPVASVETANVKNNDALVDEALVLLTGIDLLSAEVEDMCARCDHPIYRSIAKTFHLDAAKNMIAEFRNFDAIKYATEAFDLLEMCQDLLEEYFSFRDEVADACETVYRAYQARMAESSTSRTTFTELPATSAPTYIPAPIPGPVAAFASSPSPSYGTPSSGYSPASGGGWHQNNLNTQAAAAAQRASAPLIPSAAPAPVQRFAYAVQTAQTVRRT